MLSTTPCTEPFAGDFRPESHMCPASRFMKIWKLWRILALLLLVADIERSHVVAEVLRRIMNAKGKKN